MQTQGTEGFDIGVVGDLRFVAVAPVLAAQDVVGTQGPHRGEDIGLVAVHGLDVSAGRWLHGQQRDDLEQVVLHHVTQAARALKEGTAALDADLLDAFAGACAQLLAAPLRRG